MAGGQEERERKDMYCQESSFNDVDFPQPPLLPAVALDSSFIIALRQVTWSLSDSCCFLLKGRDIFVE